MGLIVSAATADDRPAACRLLAADRPPADRGAAYLRLLDLLTSGEFDPAGLFVARPAPGTAGILPALLRTKSGRDARAPDGPPEVRGAMLVQRLPGALGLAWPPAADAPAAEDALARAAVGWLRAGGVKVCQALAPDDAPPAAGLLRNGFRRVTRVVHFRRDIDPARDGGPVPPAGCPLAVERVGPDHLPALADTLLATNDGSLDCPELTGSRTPAELVEGFRGPLTMAPPWWFLAREGGRPVGVVLFDAGMEVGELEVSYLGLVPAARGRGWGDWLTRFAVRVAARDGAAALTLSIDERNDPARRLYARHGFRPAGGRAVYLAGW